MSDRLSPLAAIRDLSRAYEIDAQTQVVSLVIQCPFCLDVFNLMNLESLTRYRDHFDREWGTHKPDFLVGGEAVRIVRRL